MGKLSDTLNLARERAEALNRPYQGELTPQEAYTLLQLAPGAKLVDVRTRAEWDWVGRVPGAVEIEWNQYPGGVRNPNFATELKRYPNATEVVWCQDEPQNQGAWFFVQHYIHENMLDGQKLGYSGRAASASPAVGYAHLHQEQQKALVDGAFGKLKGFVLSK